MGDFLDRRRLHAHRLGHAGLEARRVLSVSMGVGIDRLHVRQHGLHAVGQGVIGRVVAGEHGVAAGHGHIDTIQDRAQRRVFRIGQIRVPAAAEVMLVRRLLDDAEHLRIAVHGLYVRMAVQHPEAPPERRLGIRREVLPVEEHDAVAQQGFADLGHGLVIEVVQIDAGNFGAEHACERDHGDTAERIVPQFGGLHILSPKAGYRRPYVTIPRQARKAFPILRNN